MAFNSELEKSIKINDNDCVVDGSLSINLKLVLSKDKQNGVEYGVQEALVREDHSSPAYESLKFAGEVLLVAGVGMAVAVFGVELLPIAAIGALV